MCAWESVIPCRRVRRVPPTPKQWKLGLELRTHRWGAGIGLFPHGVERARDGEENYKGRESRGRGTGSIQRKNFFTARLIHSKCGHLFCGFLQRGLVMVLCVRVWSCVWERGRERKRGGWVRGCLLTQGSCFLTLVVFGGIMTHVEERVHACMCGWFTSVLKCHYFGQAVVCVYQSSVRLARCVYVVQCRCFPQKLSIFYYIGLYNVSQ